MEENKDMMKEKLSKLGRKLDDRLHKKKEGIAKRTLKYAGKRAADGAISAVDRVGASIENKIVKGKEDIKKKIEEIRKKEEGSETKTKEDVRLEIQKKNIKVIMVLKLLYFLPIKNHKEKIIKTEQ